MAKKIISNERLAFLLNSSGQSMNLLSADQFELGALLKDYLDGEKSADFDSIDLEEDLRGCVQIKWRTHQPCADDCKQRLYYKNPCLEPQPIPFFFHKFLTIKNTFGLGLCLESVSAIMIVKIIGMVA
jgi:hypothetical protein